MSLADLQRDIQGVCLAPEPPAEALQRLGDPRIWGLYRDMVRRRLLSELKHAYKRTYAAVGDALFNEAFGLHMADDPPTARFFHAVPAGFEAAALRTFEGRDDIAAHVPDLVRYEAARWAVSDLDDQVPDRASLGELSFDAQPVLSPALRILSLRHAVHRKAGDGGYAAGTFFVALHRAADDQPVKVWTLNRVSHALLRHLEAQPESLTVAVQAVSRELGVAVDEAFLEGLCTTLADFAERRILLGSRPIAVPR